MEVRALAGQENGAGKTGVEIGGTRIHEGQDRLQGLKSGTGWGWAEQDWGF